MAAMSNATKFQSTLTVLDDNKNGKVSKTEFLDLDQNRDGRVSHHEAVDVNDDGKVTHKEKNLLDANDDGKVNRHEVLQAPKVDSNGDGKVTKHEITKAEHHHHSPPPPPQLGRGVRAPPPPRPPPRTTWPFAGHWNSAEECVDEVVLVILCAITLQRALAWLHRRLTGRGKQYKKVARVADAYGPDPGLELAEQSLDPVADDGVDHHAAAAAAAAAAGGSFSQTAAAADELFAEDGPK